MTPEEFRIADDKTKLCFIAALIGIHKDCHRYTWDFHSVRYKTISEAISARVKEMDEALASFGEDA